jgi:Flp pilus assembly protein TadG
VHVSPEDIDAGNVIMLKDKISKIRKNRNQRGATLIEFSLTLLTVLFVLFLLIEFALWIYCYNVMADAAKAGVRYAIVHGSALSASVQSGPSTCTSPCSPDCATNVTNVVTEVRKWASFSAYSTASMTVNVCYLDGTNVAPARVKVTVSNPVVPFFNIFSTPPVTATAQGRIVI